MNRSALFKILVPIVILAAAGLWYWAPIKVSVGGSGASSRQDSAEAILNHVRSTKSPLVLVNFWASWCQPCKEEMPAIKTVAEQFADRGFKVVFISIDDPEEIPAAESYLKDHKMEFAAFYKGAQSLKFVTQIFPQWSGAVPASLLMNSELKILDAWEGDSSLEELQQRVQKQLRGS